MRVRCWWLAGTAEAQGDAARAPSQVVGQGGLSKLYGAIYYNRDVIPIKCVGQTVSVSGRLSGGCGFESCPGLTGYNFPRFEGRVAQWRSV